MSDIHFVATLPRSGSTLLVNLLGQHPSHHVTGTNDLIELVVGTRDSWTKFEGFRAQGLGNIKPRIRNVLKAMMEGFYKEELKDGKVVFDKSRGWLGYINLLEEVLERPVKVLTTVRDIRAIVASMIKIIDKSVLITPTNRGPHWADMQSIEGRVRNLLAPDSVVGIAVNRLRSALNSKWADRVLIIPYRRLTSEPQNVMKSVHKFLELPEFNYDPDNVKQLTQEDDTVYGMEELHTIRTKVELTDNVPWLNVIPEPISEGLAKEYADINKLAAL